MNSGPGETKPLSTKQSAGTQEIHSSELVETVGPQLVGAMLVTEKTPQPSHKEEVEE